MPNLFDYLAWRGDLPFSEASPCENDFVILSQLAYVAFGTISGTLMFSFAMSRMNTSV